MVTPAQARDYYYFHKSGVDQETYLEDRLFCDELAGGAARTRYSSISNPAAFNNNLTLGQSAAVAGLTGLFMGFFGSQQNRRLQWQIERICLADRGYRRFEVEKKLIKEIEKLKDDAEKIDRFFELASNEEPIGEEMHE